VLEATMSDPAAQPASVSGLEQRPPAVDPFSEEPSSSPFSFCAEEDASPLDFSPADDSAEPRRPYARLYSPRAVAGAALLGGWLAGCLLLASNYRRRKRRVAAWLLALIGILGAFSILVALWKYADVPPRLGAVLYLGPIFLAQLVGAALLLGGVAKLLQGRTFAAHLKEGGKRAPFGGVAAMCLLCSGLLFLLQAFLTYPVTWDGTGRGLEFAPNQELYYTEGVTREEALRLGQKLREIGAFDDRGDRKTVILSKKDDLFVVRVFLREGAWMDEEVLAYFHELRGLLSKEVFADAPVEIVLCDQFNRQKKVIR
jgi:hypothetical protein